MEREKGPRQSILVVVRYLEDINEKRNASEITKQIEAPYAPKFLAKIKQKKTLTKAVPRTADAKYLFEFKTFRPTLPNIKLEIPKHIEKLITKNKNMENL